MTNDELIKKWKAVLDYTDKDTPPLNEWKSLYLAILFENLESNYLANPKNKNADLLKIIVPQMRGNEGALEKVIIDDKQWDVVTVQNIDDKDTYAIGEDVIIERGNHPAYIETWMKNCYKQEDGVWVWKFL
jgi:hypothetical protein